MVLSEIGDVTVIVTTKATGLAVEEVEQQITVPLERALASTPGLITIRSTSSFALSLITTFGRTNSSTSRRPTCAAKRTSRGAER